MLYIHREEWRTVHRRDRIRGNELVVGKVENRTMEENRGKRKSINEVQRKTSCVKYVTMHYTTSQCTTLHHNALHYITLHYIRLHYITMHYTISHSTHTPYTEVGTGLTDRSCCTLCKVSLTILDFMSYIESLAFVP